jgi:thiol-disulfide isomerase/thioredoxin
MATRRTTVFVTLAAMVALALGLWAGSSLMEPPKDAGTLLAISLPDTTGRDQPLAQWKGKLLVVNFWATWCEPCRDEMPEFVRLQRRYADKGLQFVGIAVDDRDKVSSYVKDIGLNYPALIGGMGAIELSKTFGNSLSALPFTIVVDPKGSIVLTQLGVLKPSQLQGFINKLL